MMKNLKILIANDDGIRSEGIAHLARAAAQFGSVWVAAPERQCSGMSVRPKRARWQSTATTSLLR